MDRASEPVIPSAAAVKRSRAWVGWLVVGVAGLLIAASFLFGSGGSEGQERGRGPRATPVAVGAITRGAITERGRYPGELDADAADISAFYGGRIADVRVRVGDRVKAGDILAELDPVDARERKAQAAAQAAAAAAEQQRVKVELRAAEVDLQRFETLLKDRVVSEQEVDTQRAKAQALRAAAATAAAREAEARAGVRVLDKQLVESAVRAPFAGRVAERYVDPGATVDAGARLIRLVKTAPLRVRFEVPEREVAGLAAGTPLRVITHGDEVGARVSGVAGEINRQRRVAVLEAVIDEPPADWLPGMFAEAIVDRRTLQDATIAPGVAVLSRLQPDGRVETGLFVAADGVARWMPVRVLARDGERVAVEPAGEGALPPGTGVLTSGHSELGDGARIEITAAPGPAAPGPEAPAPEGR